MTHAPSTSASTSGGPASSDWKRPSPTVREYRRDAVIAASLFAATLVSAWLYATVAADDEVAPAWVTVLWAAVMALPLAGRRRMPEPVAIIAALTFVTIVPLHIPELLFCNICLFLALYSVGAWSTNRRRATWLRIVIVVGMFAWLFGDLYFRSLDPETLPLLSRIGTVSPFAAFGLIQIIINLLYFGAAWYFGESAFAAARGRAALEERTHELFDERERSAAQAVTIERVRIARELHDVVAHHVSVMGVQAGAARRIIDRDPAAATSALSAIEASARSAIDDLHRMLGTLRDEGPVDGGEAAIESSTRGVAQLHELVAESNSASLPTTITVVGEPFVVPTTVELSIYRIAQEALTNTRKHSDSAATAEVRVRYRPDGVELEVSDTGVGRSAASAAGRPGLGQVGMRERVAATGGTIELGPRPRGGYLVRASFPLGEARGLRGLRDEVSPFGESSTGEGPAGGVSTGGASVHTVAAGGASAHTVSAGGASAHTVAAGGVSAGGASAHTVSAGGASAHTVAAGGVSAGGADSTSVHSKCSSGGTPHE